MTNQEIQQGALSRARNGFSVANYALIIHGFTAKGIPEEDIQPRVNVFTYQAWKALGRQVRKGERGVKVCTFRKLSKVDEDTEKVKHFSTPWYSTVFHVSQTDAIS